MGKKVKIEVRVAGVVVSPPVPSTVEGSNGARARVLMVRHRRDGEDYWVLPGGHVETGEDFSMALAREFREELAVDAESGDLLWVWDFITPARHVVNIVFRARAEVPDAVGVSETATDKRLAGARWVSAQDLQALDTRPPSLRDLLRDLLTDGDFPTGYLGRL